MSTFALKVLACDKVFYDGPCEKLIFTTTDGKWEIMAHHEQMTAAVDIGEMQYMPPEGEWQKAVLSSGLIEVENNTVTIIVYSAEKPEDIDAFRAQAALERAQEQLQEKQSIVEYHISQASLSRAMARLKSAGKFNPKGY